MIKRWHLFTLMLIALMVGIVPAAAQDDAFALGDGYSITIPDGYEIKLDPDGFFILEDRGSEIWIFTPTQLQEYVSHTQNVGGDFIIEELADLTETDLTSDITDLDIADRDGAIAEWSDGVMIAVEMRDLFYGVIWPSGDVDDATIETLVASFNGQFDEGAPNDLEPGKGSSDDGGAAAGGSSGGEDEGSGGAAGDCIVSVTTRDTARLRVGPGENRGAIAFLPVGVDVSVTGSFEEDDGDVWYQLDKEQAMPGTSANELWVSADEVDASGGCDAVGSAAAPPVIPGQVVVPPATGGEGGSGSGAPVTGTVPLAGTWSFILDPMSDASCLGTENFRVPTVDVWVDASNDRGYMDVLQGGAVLSYYNDPFVRVAGTNNYYGTISFDDGTNTQIYLSVVNNSLMTGTMVGNINVDGYACSATTRITMSRG